MGSLFAVVVLTWIIGTIIKSNNPDMSDAEALIKGFLYTIATAFVVGTAAALLSGGLS